MEDLTVPHAVPLPQRRRRPGRVLAVSTAILALAGTGLATNAFGAATTTAPAAPVGLTVPTLSADADSVDLVWRKPDAYADIVDYRIYRDGQLIGTAGGAADSDARRLVNAFYADPANKAQVKVVPHHFTVRNLIPATSYAFSVRSVNRAGVESAAVTVHQSTTAAPAVFDVTAYGAVGDGTTVNTEAIQKAIDAATPGAVVRVPAGVFKTGAIWLKSSMTLDVARGATLLGSERAADYPFHRRLFPYSTDERYHALINAQTYAPGGLHDIRIVGEGTIDGNGWLKQGVDAEGFSVAKPSNSGTVLTNGVLAKAQVEQVTTWGIKAPYPTRSDLIILRNVTNAYYGGFTMTNPANHGLVNITSRNVTVAGIRVETFSDTSSSSGNNADGVEFVNSTGLTVYDSVIDSGDDAVNLNAGLGAESADDTPTSDVWVFDNYLRNSHGGVVMGSFTGAWIQDVLAEDNVITKGDVALRMKTAPTNGGGARRVVFRDTAVKDVAKEGFIFTSTYADKNAAIVVEPAPTRARFEDVTVRNVTVDGTGGPAISVIGVPEQYHQKLRFADVRFRNAKPASLNYLKASWFDNVTFDGVADPWTVKNSTQLRFLGNTTTTAVTADAATAPTWPSGSSLTVAAGMTTATLTWTAATDNTAVTGYDVLADDRVVATVAGTATTVELTGLAPARRHTLAVRATDATGNVTEGPERSATTTGTTDTTTPTAPTAADAVTAPAAGTGITWARVTWTPATDDVAVRGYAVYANGKRLVTTDATTTTAVLTRLTPKTAYTVTVRASDASGNTVTYPATAAFTTLPAIVVDPLPR
ncbi:MAG TPA: glycoside hydrolase family 28 protein [Actinoplanes sp.]